MENNMEIKRELERLRSIVRQNDYIFREIISICEAVQTDNKDLKIVVEKILELIDKR